MPCGQQWTPARADLGRRWPMHFGVILLILSAVPRLEVLLFRHPKAAAGTYEELDPVAGVLRLQ
ncbi:MAG: hypothetical protein ABIS06_13195 [Vicinamibacterales bacterium]